MNARLRRAVVAVSVLVLVAVADSIFAQVDEFELAQATTTHAPQSSDDTTSRLVNALAALLAALGSALAWYIGVKTKLGGGQSSITTTTTIDHQPSAAQQELYRLQRRLEEEQLKQDIRDIIEETRDGLSRKIDQQDEGWKSLWVSVRDEIHGMQTKIAVMDSAQDAMVREISELKRELQNRGRATR